MCLSNVYTRTGDEDKLVCQFVSSIAVDGDDITITDVIGEETHITGTIVSVDLVKNTVIVSAA